MAAQARCMSALLPSNFDASLQPNQASYLGIGVKICVKICKAHYNVLPVLPLHLSLL